MTDAELAEALKALGMDAASYRALPLLPLVQVAWADGRVQDAERELILSLAAQRYGLEEEGMRLLRNWLHHAPSSQYVARGREALLGLCERQGFGGREHLADVITFAKDVARAAGGFFGLASISSEEALAIDVIAQALHIEHDRPWVAPEDPTFIPSDADLHAEGPPPEIVFHAEKHAPIVSRGTLVKYDELKGEQSCPVTSEGVSVGRARENHIQISYDAQVSRKHCELVERGGRFYLRDLRSTGGTWVNGERVLERRLLGGEKISVGSSTFLFQLSPEDPGT
jgi:hypothetical protein